MKYVYPACFYKEDDGRYSVIMPDFPVASYGNDLVEAMHMIQEAAAGRIMLDLADGTPLPKPTPINAVIPEYSGGIVSFVYIDTEQFKAIFDEKPVKKTLTIPLWLNRAAERKSINFSSTLKTALLEKISD